MWLRNLATILALCASYASAKKILILPFQMASHVAELTTISEALIDTGHEVYMVMGKKSPTLKKAQESRVKLLLHGTPEDPKLKIPNFKDRIMKGIQPRPIDDFRAMSHTVQTCHQILGDADLIEKIRAQAFDYALIDGIPFTQCLYILPYKLDLPFSTFTIGPDACQTGLPGLTSFVSSSLTSPKTDTMTFWERLQNTWEMIDWCSNHRVLSKSDELVSKYAPEKPHISINELARKSQLWLIDSDMLLDYPRPVMPNEVFVGGLMIKEGKTLPDNFRQIVESAKDGVIIMSFGSSAPDVKQDFFLQAFAQIKQTVLWRYKGAPVEKVPPNVHLFDWLPQAELLAHPNVKLFITHCGANGQMESVYNGVPMLHFPIFAEQPYNALRSQHHGYGLTMSLGKFTTPELVDNINELIYNPLYKEKVSKASRIMRSRPDKPVNRAVYWLEHVMTHGADHMMAQSLRMPWYELLMVDILAFVAGVLIVSLIVLREIVRMLFQICCGGSAKKVKVN